MYKCTVGTGTRTYIHMYLQALGTLSSVGPFAEFTQKKSTRCLDLSQTYVYILANCKLGSFQMKYIYILNIAEWRRLSKKLAKREPSFNIIQLKQKTSTSENCQENRSREPSFNIIPLKQKTFTSENCQENRYREPSFDIIQQKQKNSTSEKCQENRYRVHMDFE